MSYLVLARKWRPQTFDEVIGQQGVIQTLKNAIEMDRVAHAYLFCGARGVGKTTVARLLAKSLNCEKGPTPEPDNTCNSCKEITAGSSSDVFEIDGASNTGVDDVRSLRENSRYLPASSRFKIYIIDEVHMLSTSAFNALLKTLEEPPEHVKFIFATTEPHKIPLTVLSRCQRFDFKRISSETIFNRLRHILENEEASIEEEGLQLISREAAGSMRDALSLTDQVLAFGGNEIGTQQVYEALGLTRSGMFSEVISHVLGNQTDELVRLVEKLFEEGHDLKRFLEGLLWHVRHLILYRSLANPDSLVDVPSEDRKLVEEQAKRAEPLRWHQIFDVINRALDELPRSPYPRLVLETALLRLSAIETLQDVGKLVDMVDELSRQMQHPFSGHGGGQSGGGQKSGSGTGSRFSPPDNRRQHGAKAKAAQDRGNSPRARTDTATGTGTRKGGFPDGWENLVSLVSRRRPSLGSVLNHARPIEVSSRRVRISLEPGSFFSDQMKTPRNKQELTRLCRELFDEGTELVVEERQADCGVTLAESWERERREAKDEMRKAALTHPMVQEAIKIFGADVEQVRLPNRSDS